MTINKKNEMKGEQQKQKETGVRGGKKGKDRGEKEEERGGRGWAGAASQEEATAGRSIYSHGSAQLRQKSLRFTISRLACFDKKHEIRNGGAGTRWGLLGYRWWPFAGTSVGGIPDRALN